MDVIGCCGDVCSCCPRYLATRENDTGRLQEVARLWQRVGWRDHILRERKG